MADALDTDDLRRWSNATYRLRTIPAAERRSIREMAGVSRAVLADLLGVPWERVRAYENETRASHPSGEDAARYLDALDAMTAPYATMMDADMRADMRLRFDQHQHDHPVGVCQHCVMPGAMIGSTMPVAIEDVSVGSRVVGIDGASHIVVNSVEHTYHGSMYTVGARGALPVAVTNDHQFMVFPALYHTAARSGWAWRSRGAPVDEHPVWRRADELRVGDYLVSPIPRFDGPPAPDRWSDPDACWVLGLLAGDGYTNRRGDKRYHFGCVLSREDDVDRVRAFFDSRGLRGHIERHPNYWKVTYSSRAYAEDIAALIGTSSPNKHLPPFVWSSKDLASAAVGGLMAADGHVTKIRKNARAEGVKLFTTSIAMAWQAWHIAVALGERPYIRKFRRTSGYPNAKQAWTVEWSGAQKNFTARTDDWYVMPITSIDVAEYDGPVHDITVADVRTFTANGVLTHNCGGVHPRACPRVKRIAYGENRQITEVEYWPDGSWPTSDVVFPDGPEMMVDDDEG